MDPVRQLGRLAPRPRTFALAAAAILLGLGGLPCHWAARTVAAQGATSEDVRFTLSEWALIPVHVTVPLGQSVRLLARNAGVLPHALAVEGPGVSLETEAIGSGGTDSLLVTFTLAGIYDLFCPLNAGEHRALGQEATLVVLPDASSLALPGTGNGDLLPDPSDQPPDPDPDASTPPLD